MIENDLEQMEIDSAIISDVMINIAYGIITDKVKNAYKNDIITKKREGIDNLSWGIFCDAVNSYDVYIDKFKMKLWKQISEEEYAYMDCLIKHMRLDISNGLKDKSPIPSSVRDILLMWDDSIIGLEKHIWLKSKRISRL